MSSSTNKKGHSVSQELTPVDQLQLLIARVEAVEGFIPQVDRLDPTHIKQHQRFQAQLALSDLGLNANLEAHPSKLSLKSSQE